MFYQSTTTSHHARPCLYRWHYHHWSINSVTSTIIFTIPRVFPIKDLGCLSYFLGVEMHHLPDGLLLSLQNYILGLLSKANLTSTKLASSLILTSTQVSAFSGTSFDKPTEYRSIVDSLQYFAFTRPDISFVLNKVCKNMHSPQLPHWQALKHILCNLPNTLNYSLHITSSFTCLLVAYSDAD